MENKTKVISFRVPVEYLQKAEESGLNLMQAVRAYIAKISSSKKCPTCGAVKGKK